MTNELPDLIGEGLTVLFCGINPGLTAATAGHHFVNRSNRFWRVLHLAGFTPREIAPEQDRTILDYGYGLTTVVSRPTARADQLSTQELTRRRRSSAGRLRTLRPASSLFWASPRTRHFPLNAMLPGAGKRRVWKAPSSGFCPTPVEEIVRSRSTP